MLAHRRQTLARNVTKRAKTRRRSTGIDASLKFSMFFDDGMSQKWQKFAERQKIDCFDFFRCDFFWSCRNTKLARIRDHFGAQFKKCTKNVRIVNNKYHTRDKTSQASVDNISCLIIFEWFAISYFGLIQKCEFSFAEFTKWFFWFEFRVVYVIGMSKVVFGMILIIPQSLTDAQRRWRVLGNVWMFGIGQWFAMC